MKSGVCVAHGANKQYKRCDEEGCNNFAQKGGVCARHGAKRNRKECSVEDCTNVAQVRGVCRKHGAKQERKKCSEEDCSKIGQSGGVCIPHDKLGRLGGGGIGNEEVEEEPQKKRAKTVEFEYPSPPQLDTPQIQLPEIDDPSDDFEVYAMI